MSASLMLVAEPPVDEASFQRIRSRLFGIAYRVLGSAGDADDVVQEAWIRWQGADRDTVRDPTGFLVTMTARLALTVANSARARREICSGPMEADVVDLGDDPSCLAEQGEALEHALLALLERLSATERAAYVLREAFDYRHRRIAEILGLSEANRRLLNTFVAAAQAGELAPLERLLTTDIIEEGHRDRIAA
jgi:RNA polymerase sigma-70 factor, ECF subfamily